MGTYGISEVTQGLRRAAVERGGNNSDGSKDFRAENGSSQGHNLALTGMCSKFALQWDLGKGLALVLPFGSRIEGLGSASERSGDNLNRVEDVNVRAKARIRPCLSFMCHICSEAVQGYLAHKKTPTPQGPP